MARKSINLGTGELTGDGESIRSAFSKIQDNFIEVYTDISNTFSGSYNDLLDKPILFDGDYNSLSNKPTFDAYLTRTELAEGTLTVDVKNTGTLQGSVFADDSTLIVDSATGVLNGNLNGNLVGDNITIGRVGATGVAIYGTVNYNNGTTSFQSSNTVNFNGTTNFTNATITGLAIPSSDVTGLTAGRVALSGTGITDSTELTFDPATRRLVLGGSSLGVIETLNVVSHESGILYLSSSRSGFESTHITMTSSTGIVNTTIYGTLDLSNATVTGIDYGSIVGTQIQTNGLPVGTEAGGLFASNGQSLALGYKDSEGSAFSHIAFSEANDIQIQANVSVAAATTFDFNGATVNGTNFVESNTTGITGADQVSNIITLTQAEYDAIGTPNASTVYIIVG